MVNSRTLQEASATPTSAKTNLEISLVLAQETKGALKFQEISPDGTLLSPYHPEATVGALYIRKIALTRPFPNRIRVTIERA